MRTNEALTLDSLVAHPRSPCREAGVLKRHGVGEGKSEVGADFGSLCFGHN
jgi:hypothetical protein